MEHWLGCLLAKGMPIDPETYSTNADGSKNEDYCNTCYKDGAFTTDCTMDTMIDYTSQFVNEYNESTGNDLTLKEYKEELIALLRLSAAFSISAYASTPKHPAF